MKRLLKHQPLCSARLAFYHQFNSMATYTIAHTTRRFVRVLLFALFLFIILACRLLPTKMISTVSNSQLKRHIYIEGRWKSLRASLGLPPLLDVISFPSDSNFIPATLPPTRASRFDLKRKRSIELATQKINNPQLYFATDALKEQSVPLERMAASFRAIALAEKGIAIEQARTRLMRQGQVQRGPRQPSRWGTRVAKLSLGK